MRISTTDMSYIVVSVWRLFLSSPSIYSFDGCYPTKLLDGSHLSQHSQAQDSQKRKRQVPWDAILQNWFRTCTRIHKECTKQIKTVKIWMSDEIGTPWWTWTARKKALEKHKLKWQKQRDRRCLFLPAISRYILKQAWIHPARLANLRSSWVGTKRNVSKCPTACG